MKIFLSRENSEGKREVELLSFYVYQNQTLKWKLLSDSESSLEEFRHKQSQSGLYHKFNGIPHTAKAQVGQ